MKKLMGRVISVQRAARRRAAELEASKQIYTYTPIGKGEKKTFKEIVLDHRELEESEKQ